MTDETVPETQYFAHLRRDGKIVDNDRVIGVAFPSSAFPGDLVLCLDVKLVKAAQRAMKTGDARAG